MFMLRLAQIGARIYQASGKCAMPLLSSALLRLGTIRYYRHDPALPTPTPTELRLRLLTVVKHVAREQPQIGALQTKGVSPSTCLEPTNLP